MKGKTKSIALSALTIGCCSALIAGATFAAFTSTDEYHFQVQSGAVDIATTLDLVSMSYVEEGGTTPVTEADTDNDDSVVLSNGLGNAAVKAAAEEGTTATVEMLLGKGVSANFTLTVENQSTVAMKYVAYLVTDGATAYTVDGNAIENGSYILTSDSEGQKGWSTVGTATESIAMNFSIGLPWSADDAAATATSMTLVVCAVQSNAEGTIFTGGGTYLTILDAMTAAEDGGTIYLGTVNAEWPAAEAIEGLAGKTLSLVGIGTEETVIAPNAAEEGAVSFGGLNVTLQNLSVEGQADFADGIVRAENVAFADTAVSNAEADFSHCTLDGTFSVADGSTVVLSQNTFQNDEGSLLFVDDSELTIESGFYTAYGRALQANGSKVTIEDGTFENTTVNNLIHLGNTNEDPEVVASELTVNGGTFRSVGYGFTLFGDSSLVFNGGSMQSDMIAISGNNLNEGNTTIEINGGTLEAVITIYMPDAADITVNGGTLIGQSILDMRLGSMNITGQYATTLRATDPDYYPESMTRPGGGASTDGAAFNFHTNNYTDHSSQTENDPGSLTFTLAKGVAVETASGMVASVYDWNGLATEQAVSIDLGDYANDGEAVAYYSANESGTSERLAAMANGVPYASLTEAVAQGAKEIALVAANRETETVAVEEGKLALTLVNDITYLATFDIAPGAELTIDGSGVIVDSNGDGVSRSTPSHTIVNSGMLVIDGDVTIDNVTHARAALHNTAEGTAILNGGHFLRSKENGSSAEESGGNSFYTIQNYGTMTINEGVVVELDGGFSSMIENGYYDGTVNTSEKEAVMTINGGTFSGGLNAIKNDDWGVLTITGGSFLNQEQSAVMNYNELTVDGGTFQVSGKASSIFINTRLDNKMDQGILTINKMDTYSGATLITANGTDAGIITVCTEDVLNAALDVAANKTVKIGASLKESQYIVLSVGETVLDLNGYEMTVDGAGIFELTDSAKLTVTGNGSMIQTMDSTEGYLFCLWDSSELTIENGTFVCGITAVQIGDSAKASIKDGTFSALADWEGVWWILNKKDNSPSVFSVSGGTFVNFDPSVSRTENPDENFLADGYTVTSTSDGQGNTLYTVVPEQQP